MSGDVLEATRGTLRLWFFKSASEGSPDERIVQSALALVEPGCDVAVFTSDGGMEVRARFAGVRAIPVPQDLLEPDEPDPLENEVRALKAEVDQLRRPANLDVEFWIRPMFPDRSPIEFRRLHCDEGTLQGLWEETIRQMSWPIAGHQLLGAGDPNSDIARHNRSVQPYANAIRKYLLERAKYEATVNAAVLLKPVVRNNSPRSVEDVIVELTAPEGATFQKPMHLPEAPQPPQTPANSKPPLSFPIPGVSLPWARAGPVPALGNILPRQPEPTEIYDREVLIRHEGALRPDFPTGLYAVWLYVKPEFPDEPIPIRFVIWAAAGKPVRGEFVLEATHRHEAWKAPALPKFGDSKWELPVVQGEEERWVSTLST